MKRFLTAAMMALSVATTALVVTVPTDAFAATIVYVVNKNAITDYDVARRVAFLKLQGRKGNLTQIATDEMIDQVLKEYEAKRVGINVSPKEVNVAFERFAQSNKLSTKQMSQILAQANVTADHFKDYIRSQIAWGQAVSAKFRSGSQMSQQDLVTKMLESGQNQPTATEYMLQQVIFVVPNSERGKKLGARKREAEQMRLRFQSCETTKQFAKGLLDVTVRDLGRVLEPELPPDWSKFIKETKPGGVTKVRETDRGAEFIALCSARQVSDDRVAELTFRAEQTSDNGDKFSEDYLKEVRKSATINKR
jgi:peptidyl-prolyl cis-trans isomerase SurA